MAYEKINFKDGDVVTASMLNHMEDGIKNAGDKAAELDDHYGYLGEVSSLDSIPVNYMGSVGLTADISPMDKTATFTLNAFGASETRRTVQVINNATGYMYQCCKNSDAWGSWERFIGESEFNELKNDLTVTSTTLTDGVLYFSVDKVSGVKMLRCSSYPTETLTANTTYTIGTIPTDFKPKRNVSGYIVNISGLGTITLSILSGVIKIKPSVDMATTVGINILLTYI